MESYFINWLEMLFRWMHVIAGIAWIGASFYFVWLDNNLESPPRWKSDRGIKGDLWAIHGGGIYEVAVIAIYFNLDPEFVSFHHIIRLLIILFVVPIFVRKLKNKKPT